MQNITHKLAAAQETAIAPTRTREQNGWIPAAVGCHWTRGDYHVSTIALADGSRSGYKLFHKGEFLGAFIPWSEVERLADRRKR